MTKNVRQHIFSAVPKTVFARYFAIALPLIVAFGEKNKITTIWSRTAVARLLRAVWHLKIAGSVVSTEAGRILALQSGAGGLIAAQKPTKTWVTNSTLALRSDGMRRMLPPCQRIRTDLTATNGTCFSLLLG